MKDLFQDLYIEAKDADAKTNVVDAVDAVDAVDQISTTEDLSPTLPIDEDEWGIEIMEEAMEEGYRRMHRANALTKRQIQEIRENFFAEKNLQPLGGILVYVDGMNPHTT